MSPSIAPGLRASRARLIEGGYFDADEIDQVLIEMNTPPAEPPEPVEWPEMNP